MVVLLCFFFFFQAEDGIRDLTVTGVQTCALPIYDYFREEFAEERSASSWRVQESSLARISWDSCGVKSSVPVAALRNCRPYQFAHMIPIWEWAFDPSNRWPISWAAT